MLFNSYAFLFVFMPLVYGGYLLVERLEDRRWTIAWLAGASVVFYALGEAANLALLVVSIAFNYAVGLRLARTEEPRRRRLLLIAGLAGNLGALCYFKYTNFLVDSAHRLLGLDLATAHVVLPIGISFFTFTQIAYLVDSFRREAKDYSPLSYALFVTFFPHLVAGPIIHHKEMMPQFGRQRREDRLGDAAVGLTIFVIGLAKKVLIADTVAPLSTGVFAAAAGTPPTLLDAWIGPLSYAFQIYFDFSGYSDMAIGLSRLFGIRMPLNFHSPYKAVSITDFWRRWHISLSRFLRDYLYIPLGGNRRGRYRRYVNLLITMLLGGIWHGAGWTFVVWGLLHGVFLAIHQLWRSLRLPLVPRWPARILTFLCVLVAWVPFRAPDLPTAVSIWRGMIGLNGVVVPPKPGWLAKLAGLPVEAIASNLGRAVWLLPLLFVIVWAMPNTQEIMHRWRPGLVSPGYHPIEAPTGMFRWLAWRPTAGYALFATVLVVVTVLKLSDISEFIYFQF